MAKNNDTGAFVSSSEADKRQFHAEDLEEFDAAHAYLKKSE